MDFLSVCAGIDAASVAWNPIGWKAKAFSEIEPFPCAVLAHHYPTVPNWGNMNDWRNWPDANFDVLSGGTPCQTFSVAGLRAGLSDPRGNLMLTYCAIAARYRPRWVIWENVAGVLSSGRGSDFASFLGLLSGRKIAPPPKGWRKSGSIEGIPGAYGLAWRLFDAQYFGVAQRRRRVFVVGYLGDWRPPAAVLFERESMSGNPPPSRTTRKDLTFDIAPSLKGSGPGDSRPGDSRGQDPVIPVLEAGARTGTSTTDIRAGIGIGNPGDPMYTLQAGKQHADGVLQRVPEISAALVAKGGLRGDPTGETFIPSEISAPIVKRPYSDRGSDEKGLVTHTLRGEGFDASEDGTGRGVPLVPVDITNCRIGGDVSGTLEHAQEKGNRGQGVIAFHGTQDPDVSGSIAHPMGTNYGQETAVLVRSMRVRRLTPRECERLQGFEDDYTAIPYGKKGKPAADGPRYKAIGNSWAVPNARWIGVRVNEVEKIISELGVK